LDPGEYGAETRIDLSHDPSWIARLEELVARGRPALLPTYQGLGDQGGAIAEKTARLLDAASRSNGPLELRIATSEQIFLDVAAERERLPRYDGELLLRLHATGCYTSRAQLKLWHAYAEALAQTAERAAALAQPLRPSAEADDARDRLRRAWERILTHQMHDDLTGTSLPQAYRFGADDLALAIHELERELARATAAVATELAPPADGEPLLVFNPLSDSRHEVVRLELTDAPEESAPPAIAAEDGRLLASSWRRVDGAWHGRFLAEVPGLSFSRFALRRDVAPAPAHAVADEPGRLENDRYRAEIDEHGELASLFDKRRGIELLSRPAGLELLDDFSDRFPSWEIRHEDSSRAARERVDATCERRRIEHHALGSTIEVVQRAAGSTFVRRYSLAAGDAGAWLEVELAIDWRSDGTLLKLDCPFAWEFDEAIYDLGIGVARRPVATPELYEVPAQQWAAAPHPEGGGGFVLTDSKQGWDHPDLRRLRLTLLHTPRTGRRFPYQRRQDFGAHRTRYAIGSFPADDPLATLASWGERFRQPLRAFAVAGESRGRRRVWAPLAFANPAVRLQALKPAEDGPGLVLRLRETSGEPQEAGVDCNAPLAAGEALDGTERSLPPGPSGSGPAERPLGPFTLSTRRIAVPRDDSDPPPDGSIPLDIRRTLAIVAPLGERAHGPGFDGKGRRLPLHLVPETIAGDRLVHDLGPLRRDGAAPAAGQRISTPAGARRVALLVTAVGGPLSVQLRVGGREVELVVPAGDVALGRFDELRRTLPFVGRWAVAPGHLSRAPVLLSVPHRLDRKGGIEPCQPLRFFEYSLDLSAEGDEIELPREPRLLVAALTVSPHRPLAARDLTPRFRHPEGIPLS
ncbi:MAG: glycoside hydrolase family 38 C-terminal domain-containing protein, partial [Thermoanaerobaculia bacterium]